MGGLIQRENLQSLLKDLRKQNKKIKDKTCGKLEDDKV